jgi:hypothetical protein
MMGEAASTTIFNEVAAESRPRPLQELFRLVSRDESRHFAFTYYLLAKSAPLGDEVKKLITKQVRAGFVFLSLITYKPLPPESGFWKLPRDFPEFHEDMINLARDAGLGIPSLEERERAWRGAVAKVGSILRRYGVELPSIPELGIDQGEFVEPTEEPIIVF